MDGMGVGMRGEAVYRGLRVVQRINMNSASRNKCFSDILIFFQATEGKKKNKSGKHHIFGEYFQILPLTSIDFVTWGKLITFSVLFISEKHQC
jgi:hypothetical protein